MPETMKSVEEHMELDPWDETYVSDPREEVDAVAAGALCPSCENWKSPSEPCSYCAPDQY